MAKDIKMEDIVEKVDSTSETTTEETTEEIVEQDPLKTELERVQKTGKTEKEKAEYSLKKNADRVRELGGDPTSILGVKVETDDEDDKPLTRGEFKKMQLENASKTAIQQAEEITNETERELVKYHLQNTIRSTGIPSEDIKLARALVNSVKNTKVIEEVARKTEVKTHSNGTGVDAKIEKEIVYTPDEIEMMKPPFKMTSAQILAARENKKYEFKSLKL